MKNADKPASPIYHESNDGHAFICENGLTKFEKVAAMAMQGFAASADDRYGTPQEVAKDGIAAAHAFFNELETENEQH